MKTNHDVQVSADLCDTIGGKSRSIKPGSEYSQEHGELSNYKTEEVFILQEYLAKATSQ